MTASAGSKSGERFVADYELRVFAEGSGSGCKVAFKMRINLRK